MKKLFGLFFYFNANAMQAIDSRVFDHKTVLESFIRVNFITMEKETSNV